VVKGASRYWDKLEMANVMSGCVKMVAYIKHPIISWYFVFSVAVGEMAET
jgi:hypothetical protein